MGILLETELPAILSKDAEDKWEEFRLAAQKAGLAPLQDQAFISTLLRVFACSEFISANCIKDPSLLFELHRNGDLSRRYASGDHPVQLNSVLAAVSDETDLIDKLRIFRRREMIRIAWRDIAGWADLAETTGDLSALADTCLHQALALLHDWESEKHGAPSAPDGTRQQLVVFGLGKLGSRELNFSSDIDLIFGFPKTGATLGSDHAISNDEFFIGLCRRLIKVIGQLTPRGLVFRVDLRLRPFGDSGPIAMSFDALERYYQEQGRDWERYAWIKARAVAGDKSAGSQFLKRLRPFIYRRYLDFGAFDSLRSMKQMIAAEIRRKGMQNNIKLGPGGIREIEFFGQIFQLIRGGVTSALQEGNIQKVLIVLASENYIPLEVARELDRAYVFLRNTEHRLQEFSDQQTHELPLDKIGQTRLASAMGYADAATFETDLDQQRHNVHRHFQMLLETGDGNRQTLELEKQFEEIWKEVTTRHQAQDILSAAGFDDPDEILQLMDFLRNDTKTRALSPVGRQRLDKLIPLVLKESVDYDQPTVTFRRMIDLIKSIERRTSYLALLLESPSILNRLVSFCNASPWIASFLARHPVLLDELMDTRTLYRPPAAAELEKELHQRIIQESPDDLEEQIEALCIFNQSNVLRVAAADVAGVLPLMRVSDHLSAIAETVISEVIELAWNHLTAKHGVPSCRLQGKSIDRGFAVIAYGKLGGLELGYGSDLDLVFLHAGSKGMTEGGQRPIDNAQFFNRLGQRVIHILTAHTRAGKAYEIDMRLRPSGSSGILVSHIDAFREYQLNEAWTWEHQALIKARPISGAETITGYFEKIRHETLALKRNGTKLKNDVTAMRQRMRTELLKNEPDVFDLKQSIGGMVDIEFLVQYLVLLESRVYPQLLQWTDNVRLLQTLIEGGVMDEYTAHLLKHAYLIYRATAHQLSLQEKPAAVQVEKFSRLQNRVQQIWRSYFETTE